MSYEVKIIADSVAPHGVRIVTLRATYPRFIHAEMLRHRVFSHSVASSRAIPPEKLIRRVEEDPFVPTFNKRVKGMGVGSMLEKEDQQRARNAWMAASRHAVDHARVLLELEIDKSRVNRLLEPFLWVTDLITATEWSNFFALRDHPDAQPEFQVIARMMREAMEQSVSEEIDYGDWHLPLLSADELASSRGAEWTVNKRYWAMISAGRCFTVSYDRDSSVEAATDSHARAVKGTQGGHWSPLEHPAIALLKTRDNDSEVDFSGNFRGFLQLRKFFPGEQNFQILLNAASICG